MLSLKDADHLGRLRPKALEVVEFSLLRPENVDDYIAEVQQHPAGAVQAFSAVLPNILLFKRAGNIFFQALNLPGGLRGHYDEVVSERRDSANIQHYDVRSQLVRCYINNQLRQLCRIQTYAPAPS